MQRPGLATIAFLACSLGGIPAAFALTNQSGNAVPGAFANLADPDEQMPTVLRTPNGPTASSRDNFDDNHEGQGFVNQDVIARSNARQSGDYLPPDPEK